MNRRLVGAATRMQECHSRKGRPAYLVINTTATLTRCQLGFYNSRANNSNAHFDSVQNLAVHSYLDDVPFGKYQMPAIRTVIWHQRFLSLIIQWYQFAVYFHRYTGQLIHNHPLQFVHVIKAKHAKCNTSQVEVIYTCLWWFIDGSVVYMFSL